MIDATSEHATWVFPADPGAVRGARHEVRDTLHAWRVPADVTDVAVLLVSELVTNAYRHARGPIGVRVRGAVTAPGQDVLLVEVSDPQSDPPVERAPGPDDEGGRGLRLVACSAGRWGTRTGRVGKTVWFELPLHG